MKNPNGFGCVYKASGNRRKPYIARITVGWDDNGKQLFEPLGSFETKAEGIQALLEYHDAPYDLYAAKKTFAEVYEDWYKKKFTNSISTSSYSEKGTSDSNRKSYETAFRDCSKIHKVTFRTLRTCHLQAVIDECKRGYTAKTRIKMLLGQLYNYGLKMDMLKKDYSAYLNIGPKPKSNTSRTVFTDKEIIQLFSNANPDNFLDTIIIMLFHGLRPTELLTLETDNIFFDKHYFIGGIKTEAGRNRMIPISKFAEPFLKYRYEIAKQNNQSYLFLNTSGGHMNYSNYNRDKFVKMMAFLNMQHTPYDCRHSFATYMDKVNANKLCTQKIMGHSPKELIDKVYTHKSLLDLQKEINKLESLFDLGKLMNLVSNNYGKYMD